MRARRVATALALVALASVTGPGAVASAQERPAAAAVEQPARAFGRVIGDVLVQRIALDGERDASAFAESLPPGRIGAWLERLPVRVLKGAGGPVLELRYQIVNAPTGSITVRLPPVSLARGDGRTVAVPEWPVGIGPLTPREIVGEGDLLAMRPDRRLPAFDTDGRRAQLLATALALASVALAWFGWWAWRRRVDRVRLPFARARHALRRLPAAARDEAPEAWTALHRALDDTAGGTVHRGSLDRLFDTAPWLAPSRAAIERFYAASAARFFSQPARAEPFALGELAGTLYRAERRNT